MTSHSDTVVTDEQIIDRLTEISDGVDLRFAGFVWEQTAHDLGVSEERILKAVEYFLAWEEARLTLESISTALESREGDDPPPPSEGYVYVFKNGRYFKLGSSINPEQRLKAINRNIPPGHSKVIPWLQFKLPLFREVEAKLKMVFESKKVTSETGGVEWFDLTQADLDWIAKFMRDWDSAS
jgi:hypothetical protein